MWRRHSKKMPLEIIQWLRETGDTPISLPELDASGAKNAVR
jgi:hypothetical protein